MTSRLLAGLLLALATLSLSALPALAHAELEGTDPVDGGTISTPYTMTGTFSEPLVGNSRVVIRNSDGDEVASASVSDSEDATVLTVELPELPEGEYTARWTAVTDDGHTERFTTTFVVVAAATPTPTEAPRTPQPTDTASAAPTTAAPTTAPTVAPTPVGSPEPVDPAPAGGNDLLIALLVAGIAVAGVLGYLFFRNRS